MIRKCNRCFVSDKLEQLLSRVAGVFKMQTRPVVGLHIYFQTQDYKGSALQ